MYRRIRFIFSSSLGVLLLAQSGILFAAPSAELWARWTEHDPASTQTIQHSRWDTFLARYLVKHEDGINRLNYAAVSKTDRLQLKDYLASLSNTKISDFNRNQQLAYWINLYNALTVNAILDYYPIRSIRDISGGLFSSGPWNKQLITVEAENLSLNDIEHRILRPIWQDARIHYVVNCASFGCPNLQPRAFSGDQIEMMLDRAAREFVNHKRAAYVGYGNLSVSSIYDWYEADFGGSETAVIQHLRRFAGPALKARLDGINKISDYHYDWALNDTSKPEAASRGRRSAGS